MLADEQFSGGLEDCAQDRLVVFRSAKDRFWNGGDDEVTCVKHLEGVCKPMGVVWKAHEPALDRQVAIKLLAPDLAASDSARRRFLQESRAAARVVDDRVVTVHAVDQQDDRPYLVMSYIPGQSLEQLLRTSGLLDTDTAVSIARDVALGLGAAHRAGVVHRDIKPGNILIEQETGRAQLVDFGLARAADDASLTRTGFIAGTPEYMSPEQIAGSNVDHRTDLYSLGTVLFRMVTGKAPFAGEAMISVVHKIVHEESPRLKDDQPHVPAWLDEVVRKLMTKDSTARFQSADELLRALERCGRDDTTGATPCQTSQKPFNRVDLPRWIGVGAISLVSLFFFAGWSTWPAPRGGEGPDTQSRPRSSATARASCVVHQPAGDRLSCATLSAAIAAAKNGDIVELSDRETHVWKAGIALDEKQITIRARHGACPRIVVEPGRSELASLTVEGALVLEGLRIEFQRPPPT